MGLTKEQQLTRRQIANEFLTWNEVSECEIIEFINTHFLHSKDGTEYYSVLPVKDYVDKEGKTQKTGTKSSFTLDDFYELATTDKVVGKGVAGKDWTQKIKCEEAEYWEIRPNLNNSGKTMAIIDIDGWKTGGDIDFAQLWEKLPAELTECAFFLSRTKSLPHFVFWVEDFPTDIDKKQYIGVLKDFEGDILFNHAWERVDNKLYNAGEDCEIATLNWKKVIEWVKPDPNHPQAKKLLPKPVKKETKPKVVKSKKTESESGTDCETASVLSKDQKQIETDCLKIKELFVAILEIAPTRFDKYSEWAQLGYLIYNQTNGSDLGCDLFVELSNLREEPAEVSFNTCSKQYNATQKCRNKEEKLFLPSMYKWLIELDPEHPLLKANEEERLKRGEMRAEEIRMTKSYLEYAEKFEATNFKLNNPVRYCEEYTDLKRGKCWVLRNRVDFLERYRDIEGMPIYLVKGGMGASPKSFAELWLDDPVKRKYSRFKFDPTNTEEQGSDEDPLYNAFAGWVNDKGATPIKEDQSDFIKLMKWLLVEEKVFEYFKCWLAHIIQNPSVKTKVAPILYSKTHGTGKNSLIDGCIAIIGRELCAMVECIEDITKNFNSHLCNRLFIYGDEICANAKKVADKLKAVITRPTTNLEKKGVDAIEIDDLTNWIFSSNNENNIKVEEGDRRFLMVRCREEKQHLLSKASYAEIGNPDKLAQLFAFFKDYKQSEESVKMFGRFNIGCENVIETEYKKQMIYEHRPAYIQMLYKNTNDLIGRSFTTDALHKFIQDWAKKNYCSSNFTIQEFSKHSKQYLEIYKKRGNTGYKYTFPVSKVEILKHLFQADEPYYRYVKQLDDDFTPDFKEPDNKLKMDLNGNPIWNSSEYDE